MRIPLICSAAVCLLLAVGCGNKEKPEHSDGDGHDHASPATGAPAASIGPESSGVKVDMSKGWCTGHGVPESVCTRCDESLIPRFKAAGDWCGGHGLPESQCIKCNPEVKAKWAALKPQPPATQEAPAASPQTAWEKEHPETRLRLLTGANDPACDTDQMQIRLADPSVVRKAGIEVEPASPRQIAAVIEAPAEVEYNATRLVRVTPRVKGVLTRSAVDLGDRVEAGDLLAIIESAELGEAKSRYLELRENLALAEADLERAEAVFRSTQQLLEAFSTATEPADILPLSTEAVAGEAKGRLVNAAAERALARTAFDRAERLKSQEAISQEAYESARATLRKAEAEHAIARDAVGFESRRNRLAADKSVRIARNALDVARRRLQLLGVGDDQIEALGAGSQEQLSRYELHSPAGGQVIDRRAVTGESVDEQDSLYAIADLSALWLNIDVPLRDAGLLAPGQAVDFAADGLRGENLRGQLTWISTEVDDRARTVKARAVLPNEHGRVRAKMFGTARIALHGRSDVLGVRTDAVQTDGCCQLVFVQKSDAVFEPRKVRLGAAAGGYVEILDGLASGESVVTTGSFLMKTEILKSSIGAGCCEVDPGR